MIVTYVYVCGGQPWHSGQLDTCHIDPQAVADDLARLPAKQPTDEIRVWVGDAAVGAPSAVAVPGGR